MPSSPLMQAELVNPTTATNQWRISCARPACRCLILRQATATWAPLDADSAPTLTEIPAHLIAGHNGDLNNTSKKEADENVGGEALQPQYFWKVRNMMDFENVGFLKTVESTGIKYLSCADCDLAPLGFHDTRVPKEDQAFYIAADRVKYTPVP
ncbi:hypothetical protein H4R33_002604 [Dimargaris cristalligena]|nr:hypothetical protein H4R33_002604 [Dimargaris cristalligena]